MMSLISLYEKFENFIMKIFYAIVVIASVIIPVGLFLQVLCSRAGSAVIGGICFGGGAVSSRLVQALGVRLGSCVRNSIGSRLRGTGGGQDGILHIVLPAPQQQKALPANPNLIEIE